MSRISVRGIAVVSATAVTAMGAVVGLNTGDQVNQAQAIEVADATLLADIPAGNQAQLVSDNVVRQAEAQAASAEEAAKQAAEDAARRAAAEEAARKKAEEERRLAEERRRAEEAAAAEAAAARAAAEEASRSESRSDVGSGSSGGGSYSVAEVQAMAQSIIGDATQFQCFSNIVTRESGWNYTAQNPSSGAYGLVQALPGSKMASHGADWQTNPETQIRWGLDYMNGRYGSPCGAWQFWQANHWY
ncbi:aggregation-promoting factor C-terminal-like domain-containing protein [Allostreptomyces psammosilenae]|uniref:Murein DD-endopeptidase MepM/ murein hydrolase activator NlpD n=1 Tax=Allostreptomyces psammosilenae TaxID=1892865 RepID=A0A853ACE1_9ACTN|nr:transglycosylase SLT domain-containing protein [Allostreptomyces psammosilenae]NYI08032.1 murein DD-endopeptidase MepM/ murein hydrolase activator NlpD [Allostreptomyces psammosilenae]